MPNIIWRRRRSYVVSEIIVPRRRSAAPLSTRVRGSGRGKRESSVPTFTLHPVADGRTLAALVARGRCIAGRRGGVDVPSRVYECTTRETEFGTLEPCTIHTHTPTRLLSILWRACFACNIQTYTHTHTHTHTRGGRAHRWCNVWFWVFIYFFTEGFRIFSDKRSAGPSFASRRCHVGAGTGKLKSKCATRFDIPFSPWKSIT